MTIVIVMFRFTNFFFRSKLTANSEKEYIITIPNEPIGILLYRDMLERRFQLHFPIHIHSELGGGGAHSMEDRVRE